MKNNPSMKNKNKNRARAKLNDTSLKLEEESPLESKLITSASARDWKSVEELLKMSTYKSCQWNSKCCTECFYHHNTLHFLLKYNLPLNIVRQIVKNEPKSILEMDCNDHYPLQTALAWGASSNVVEFLISKNKDAFFTLDKEGKTPMHLAVDGYEILNVDPSTCLTSVETFSEIIDMLYDIKSSCMARRDHSNMNVVKYAMSKKVDKKIVSRLLLLKNRYLESKINNRKDEIRPSLLSNSVRSRFRRMSISSASSSLYSKCSSSLQDSIHSQRSTI